MSEQIEAALDQATVAIAAEGIVFAFRRRRVLDNFTLNAPKGGIYGLLGRNGAGKTTALKLLMGILRPRQGRIRHLDTEVDRVTPRMRRRVGYVSRVEPYQRRDLDHADAAMRPRKHDYDCYMALVQYGRDHGWDQRLIATQGPFRVADVGMSMMLQQANRDLAEWATALGDKDNRAVIEGWISTADQGLHRLWDPSARCFCSRDEMTGQSSGQVTSASFLAIYAGVAAPHQTNALIDHWDRIERRVTYMLPSFDPEHSLFDERRYWRGPCWAVVNFMVYQGLVRAGLEDRAARLEADTRTMMELSDFREAFSPLDGTGSGGRNFSWTAAIWLAWAGRNRRLV